jgi:hypothetical protein
MSQRESVECGQEPAVRVVLIEGDLEILGTGGTVLEATVQSHGQITLHQEGEGFAITANRNTRLRLPRKARLHVAEVRGDLQVRNLEADLEIERVGGDADLRGLERTAIGRIGGDLRATNVRGEVRLTSAGGDVRLADVAGPVRVALGGDLTVKEARSPLEATAGGDAVLLIDIAPSGPVKVVAGGDITCRLQAEPSAIVSLASGGSQTVDFPQSVRKEGVSGRFILGEGGPEISLKAGGDVWLGGVRAPTGVDDIDDIGSRVAASVGKTLAEVEAGLSAMGAVMESVPEAEISTKVQKIVQRAIRRGQRGRLREMAPLPVAAGGPQAASAASDEERMKILKMVEGGKLSVEEAEKLFKALEA